MLFEEIDLYEVTKNNLDNNKFAGFGWQSHDIDKDGLLQFGYIFGFKEASDIIVDHMEAFNDALMFPVFFCYRQYLELLLKNIYRKGLADDVQYKNDINGGFQEV